jgi:lysophospholipase L1-like esterase
MKRFAILRNRPVVWGAALIATGVLFRRLIEVALVPDRQITQPGYLAAIGALQLLAIAAGAFLVIKQPAVRGPSRTEVLLLASSTALTFGVLEVGARLWLNYLATPEQYDRYVLYTSIEPEDYAWTPHHYLGYYPTPEYQKGLTSHNSLGYRNDEFPTAKPDGVYRIVVLGGSSTYDVRIEDNHQTFAAQLEEQLNDEYGFQKVEVINAGVPGYSSWEMLINFEFRVLDLEPDLVIVYEGTNDVHARLVEPSAYRGDNSGRRRPWQTPPVPLWENSALLRILSRLANVTRQVSVDDFVSAPTFLSWPYESRLSESHRTPAGILQENPPTYFRRNLEAMLAIADERGVEVLLATWAYSPYLGDYASKPDYQQGFEENNRVVREVALSHHLHLFDFAEVMPQDTKYWADGRHSNEAGAALKASLFAEYLHSEGLLDEQLSTGWVVDAPPSQARGK